MVFVKSRYGNGRRLQTVDVLQGLAMLWVVTGHHLFDFMPAWYRQMYLWIYSFHMPFFIFISGFLIAYSYKGIPYKSYIFRRFRKFFVPYVLIGITVTVLAAVKSGFGSFSEDLLYLLIAPKRTDATFLWYIYLLFIFYVIYPVLANLRNRRGICIDAGVLLLGIVFYLYPARSALFCLDNFTSYFLFFAIGIVSAWHIDYLHRHLMALNLAGVVCLIAFVALTVLRFTGCNIYMPMSFVAIPAMYGLAVLLKYVDCIKRWLTWISKNCFHIYLLHMFFIQGIALVMAPTLQHGGVLIPVYLIMSVVISVIGPVLLFDLYDKVKLKIGDRIK